MEGALVGTLYKLAIQPIVPSTTASASPKSTALTATSSSANDLTLWHNRMGHVNTHTIRQMSDHDSLRGLTIHPASTSSNVCQGCALGKQHKTL